ncbi:MAG: hypothetical protein ACK4IY_09465 [Chitinophagales bacterium]
MVNDIAQITSDGAKSNYKSGDVVKIRKGMKHRIFYPGEMLLEFIEVKRRAYFGEVEIVHR